MSEFKWRQYEGEIILWAVRWYCRYGISYRNLEQMMGERGVGLDHSTIYRWVQKYAPEIEKRLRWQWRRPRSTALDELRAEFEDTAYACLTHPRNSSYWAIWRSDPGETPWSQRCLESWMTDGTTTWSRCDNVASSRVDFSLTSMIRCASQQ
jgi:hypothetical protein